MKLKHPLIPKATWNQWSVGVAWQPMLTWGTPARRIREVYVFLGPLVWTFQFNRKG